jgi:hypothetical protein
MDFKVAMIGSIHLSVMQILLARADGSPASEVHGSFPKTQDSLQFLRFALGSGIIEGT